MKVQCTQGPEKQAQTYIQHTCRSPWSSSSIHRNKGISTLSSHPLCLPASPQTHRHIQSLMEIGFWPLKKRDCTFGQIRVSELADLEFLTKICLFAFSFSPPREKNHPFKELKKAQNTVSSSAPIMCLCPPPHPPLACSQRPCRASLLLRPVSNSEH